MEAVNISIKNWAEADRPREKLARHGRKSLTDAELLAIVLGSGSRSESAVELSKRILLGVGNNISELGKLEVSDLIKYRGVGAAKAIGVVAALELGRRRRDSDKSRRVKVKSSKDVFKYIYPSFSDLKHEEFWVILLNRGNYIIDAFNISKGGVDGTVADTRIIFKTAIEKLASAMILCHNHPSGNLNPSVSDINLTKKLKSAGGVLDIPVLDHLIIGEDEYYSFSDEGQI